MGDPHQYPVYFECPEMDSELKRRIENYFHIRRKSGGGECGAVTKVNDKVYMIVGAAAESYNPNRVSFLAWLREEEAHYR